MTSIKPFSASSGADPWDQAPSTSARRQSAKQKTVVRDDWDDDEDEEDAAAAGEPTVESNQKLWNSANAHATAPMPVIVPSGPSAHSTAPPPPAAFQPALKILKRPTNAAASPSPPPATNGQTLQEREARYQAARERIFGPGSSSAEASNTSLPSSKAGSKEDVARLIRQPKGPEDNDQREKGFKRRGNKGSTTSATPVYFPPPPSNNA
ncbi:hypothetical protein BD626DRAFT_484726 [Schizophyllum amplum]|uniref:SUZ domain-containing protein n=1 Tax=Schizophyllum amplum TaxID=97359 RepID=A0A550CQL4_9AGAR|nr:hypothetical protein BD626DRAFT_484726 [Auriculariopsis ampla]